jgi:RNA polymerase sigma factor (sigma-70 family)
MSDDASLEALLARWNGGDLAAATEAVLACEPYVRMVVRRQLTGRARSKFDSEDIAQSIWADVLRGLRRDDHHFSDAAHLRAYLATLARHRVIDRLRQHRAALDAERPLEDDAGNLAEARQPRPSDVAQAGDLWEQIRTLCPPAHHELLDLKRQGLSPTEIAERTGLHERSVRRILYDVAKRLALGESRGQSPDSPPEKTAPLPSEDGRPGLSAGGGRSGMTVLAIPPMPTPA